MDIRVKEIDGLTISTPGRGKTDIEFSGSDRVHAAEVARYNMPAAWETDLCSIDPGMDVDVYLVTDLRKLTEVWMGYTPIKQAMADETLVITGERRLVRLLNDWFTLNPYARIEKKVA